MESNVIVMVAGAVMSLVFGYVPGLRQWYEAQDAVRKAQVMAACLIVAAVLVFVGACYTPWQALECTGNGFWQLLKLLFYALAANQATYLIAVKPTRTAAEQA